MKFSNRQISPSTHERLTARLEGFTIASGRNPSTIDRRVSGIDGFAQRGGLGNLSAVALAKAEAHQLFSEQLPKLLDEMNTVLGA
jgi:hypothetical protein